MFAHRGETLQRPFQLKGVHNNGLVKKYIYEVCRHSTMTLLGMGKCCLYLIGTQNQTVQHFSVLHTSKRLMVSNFLKDGRLNFCYLFFLRIEANNKSRKKTQTLCFKSVINTRLKLIWLSQLISRIPDDRLTSNGHI